MGDFRKSPFFYFVILYLYKGVFLRKIDLVNRLKQRFFFLFDSTLSPSINLPSTLLDEVIYDASLDLTRVSGRVQWKFLSFSDNPLDLKNDDFIYYVVDFYPYQNDITERPNVFDTWYYMYTQEGRSPMRFEYSILLRDFMTQLKDYTGNKISFIWDKEQRLLFFTKNFNLYGGVLVYLPDYTIKIGLEGDNKVINDPEMFDWIYKLSVEGLKQRVSELLSFASLYEINTNIDDFKGAGERRENLLELIQERCPFIWVKNL